jgi:predicted glycogen debranching enzyme
MKNREKITWRSPLDGPWPMVHIGGDLDNCDVEWLITNGAGAYAMSTVALMHTRRHHGLLVASIGQLDRYVVVSHVETTVEAEGKTHRLSTHQFPNVAPTPGYRSIETFSQDPLPRWVFRVGKNTLERTISFVRNKNAIVLSYSWTGREPARLLLRPLLPLRPVEELMHEHGGMLQKVTLRSGVVEVQPVRTLPPVLFRHEGVFMGSPDWWRRFEYLEDRGRYEEFQEDQWCPGVLELTLEPRKTEHVVIALGELPDGDPADLVMDAAQHLLAQDPGEDWSPAVRALDVAAEQYVLEQNGTIVAGYPWLDVWARDTLVALPGIHLARGRIDRAKTCLAYICASLERGLLPQRLGRKTDEFEPALDATLWLFEAVRQFAAQARSEQEFVRDTLFPALKSVFERVAEGESDHVWLTPEGLIENGDESTALTWMDARTGTHLVTPRKGLAVELQALWARGCDTLASLARGQGDHAWEEGAVRARDRVRDTFRQRFWCNETEYPFDCVSADREAGDAWADPSIRPNALIALALDPELFEPWQRRAVLKRAERELLTPRGVRSLAPSDPNYVGHVGGTIAERQATYHQGPVWTYLVSFYVRASLAVQGHDAANRQRLRDLVVGALEGGIVLGHVAQTADGDAPHRWRGCPAQACSVAVLLELLVTFLPEEGV